MISEYVSEDMALIFDTQNCTGWETFTQTAVQVTRLVRFYCIVPPDIYVCFAKYIALLVVQWEIITGSQLCSKICNVHYNGV